MTTKKDAYINNISINCFLVIPSDLKVASSLLISDNIISKIL